MEIIKTILAYTIAIILCPAFSGLASLLFLPILSIPFFRTKFPSMLLTHFMGVASGFSAVWFATVVFSWFSLSVGNLMLVILSLAFLQNNIYRSRTRRHTGFEYRFLFSVFLGIAIAASIFIWGYGFNQISTPLSIVISIIVAFAYLTAKGNVEFWELLVKHQAEGYLFLKSSEAWFIVEESEDKKNMSTAFKWDGPFIHYFPLLGKRVKLYGKVGEYEKSQEEFVSSMKKNL